MYFIISKGIFSSPTYGDNRSLHTIFVTAFQIFDRMVMVMVTNPGASYKAMMPPPFRGEGQDVQNRLTSVDFQRMLMVLKRFQYLPKNWPKSGPSERKSLFAIFTRNKSSYGHLSSFNVAIYQGSSICMI